MLELLACSAAVFVFAAIWLAVYKLGGLDWSKDTNLVRATRELTAAHLALDGELHGAAARLSPAVARQASGRRSDKLFSILANQARMSVPGLPA